MKNDFTAHLVVWYIGWLAKEQSMQLPNACESNSDARVAVAKMRLAWLVADCIVNCFTSYCKNCFIYTTELYEKMFGKMALSKTYEKPIYVGFRGWSSDTYMPRLLQWL